jgi:hypothetical protein
VSREASAQPVPPVMDLLAPVVRRYSRVTGVVFIAAAALIVLAHSEGVPTVVVLLPALVALALSPLIVRVWWPGMTLRVWIDCRRVDGWKRATGQPYSRAGAARWLGQHPADSLTAFSALGILNRRDAQRELLKSLIVDTPRDRWRLAYAHVILDLAEGREPDLDAVKQAGMAAIDDVPGSTAEARAAYLAYLGAWKGALQGGNSADLISSAARTLDLSSLGWSIRLKVWARRFRGPAICAGLLILLSLVCR